MKANKVDTCKRAEATYIEEKQGYVFLCFNQPVFLSPSNHIISGLSHLANQLLVKMKVYAEFAIPHYLIHAQETPCMKQWVNPRALKGGDFFTRGTHQLPLDAIAIKYNSNPQDFISRCAELGGAQQEFADLACILNPLPRVPVLFMLWIGDEEFPPRVEFLLDSVPAKYFSIDILWAIAMMCVQALM